MAITLTQTAADRIRTYLDKGDGNALRFGVRKTGCSGFAYVVDITSEANADDHVFSSQGIQVYVDPDSFELIDGTTIHFTKQELAESFVFQNPNVSAQCGCGESFTVD
ncbi:MAG: iron-sulfur cluster assembly accessory protein [Acidiferrobacterales bacterium]|nr:iron-sulfur cluster assembly accessory protein [Acidiferrobacterales bacterium]